MSTRSPSVIRGGVIRYLAASYGRKDSVLGPVLRAIPLNATTRQVLSLKRSEQRAYLENLHRFNDARPSEPAKARSAASAALYKMRLTAGLFRRFNQLPCTVETREKRGDLLAGVDPETARVLVLGDDDLVSVELARRGFRHVAVADCDDDLLDRIRRETLALPSPPQIIRADFRQGFKAPEPADVVFLDPPYSIDGALAFLRLALAAAKPAPTTRIYLMINQAILGSAFAAVTDAAAKAGFRLTVTRPGFNAYPIGPLEAGILKTAWKLVLGLPAPKGARGGILFFSDCFEFEYQAGFLPVE